MNGATLTVDFTLDGYRLTLALQGETGAELLDKAGAVLAKLGTLGATPTAPPAMTTIAAGENGNGQPDDLPAEKICPIHGAKMTRKAGKGGDVWYSHKAYSTDGDEFWCRGK